MSVVVCYAKCWSCQSGDHFDPPQWHTWADQEDIDHAVASGLDDPVQEPLWMRERGRRREPVMTGAELAASYDPSVMSDTVPRRRVCRLHHVGWPCSVPARLEREVRAFHTRTDPTEETE